MFGFFINNKQKNKQLKKSKKMNAQQKHAYKRLENHGIEIIGTRIEENEGRSWSVVITTETVEHSFKTTDFVFIDEIKLLPYCDMEAAIIQRFAGDVIEAESENTNGLDNGIYIVDVSYKFVSYGNWIIEAQACFKDRVYTIRKKTTDPILIDELTMMETYKEKQDRLLDLIVDDINEFIKNQID